MTDREVVHSEVISELKSLGRIAGDDPEAAHSYADSLLCRFLREIGYGDIADAFDAIEPKWYA